MSVLGPLPPVHEGLGGAQGTEDSGGRYARITVETRDDLHPPANPEGDVLVIDFAGFRSESFGLDSASRFLSEAVRRG